MMPFTYRTIYMCREVAVALGGGSCSSVMAAATRHPAACMPLPFIARSLRSIDERPHDLSSVGGRGIVGDTARLRGR